MTSRSLDFVTAEGAEREVAGPGITRQFLGYGPDLMAVKVWFEKGAVGEVHEHFHSQVSYVESGVFDVQVGSEVKRLVAGDSFYVDPHVDHGAVCIEAGVLIDMFNPVRQDFLEGETYSNED